LWPYTVHTSITNKIILFNVDFLFNPTSQLRVSEDLKINTSPVRTAQNIFSAFYKEYKEFPQSFIILKYKFKQSKFLTVLL
jgi:hypothetical protein